MPTITLPNGDKRPFDRPVSGAELAASIGPGLAKAALAVSVDGEVKDLSHVISKDAKVAIVTKTSPEALEIRTFAPEAIPWPEIAFKTMWFALIDWLAKRRPDLPAPDGARWERDAG